MVVRAYYMNLSEKVTTAGNSHIYSPSVIDCMFKRYTMSREGAKAKQKSVQNAPNT